MPSAACCSTAGRGPTSSLSASPAATVIGVTMPRPSPRRGVTIPSRRRAAGHRTCRTTASAVSGTRAISAWTSSGCSGRPLSVKSMEEARQHHRSGSLEPPRCSARALQEGGRMDQDETQLLRALRDEYAGPLWRYVVSLTGDRDLAEDVVQETLLRAWRR